MSFFENLSPAWIVAGILFIIVLIPRSLLSSWIRWSVKGLGALIVGSVFMMSAVEDGTAFMDRFEEGMGDRVWETVSSIPALLKRRVCALRPSYPELEFICDDYSPPISVPGITPDRTMLPGADAGRELRLRSQPGDDPSKQDQSDEDPREISEPSAETPADPGRRIEIVFGAPGSQRLLQMQPGLGRIESAKDCDECPELVLIPPGSFKMGASPFDSDAKRTERPAHRVNISKAFLISKYEITQREWRACVRAGSCKEKAAPGRSSGRGDLPVVNVSWVEATTFAAWMQNRTGKRYRLPSEAEWEYAARSTSMRRFWWGHETEPPYANYNPSKKALREAEQVATSAETGGLAPARSYPPNFWGLYHVHGNANEWVRDCWTPGFGNATGDGRPVLQRGSRDCARRVVRSGSWLDRAEQIRVSSRRPKSESRKDPYTGFRLVREIDLQ